MSAGGRILVTPRSLTASPHPALDALGSAGYDVVFSHPGALPDEAALLLLVPGCVGWLAGVEPVSAAVVHAATELRAISRNGVGTDNLPLAVLRERGIRVDTAGGANASGVAELTLGLMLAALRHIPAADAGIKAGGWPRLRGGELGGRTVGVVGCGAIGRRVANLCVAFGAAVLGYDPAHGGAVPRISPYRSASFQEILTAADIVTLHCPPPENGAPLIGRAELATMRAGAILVNASRGSLIDETAVGDALNSGRLEGYAADTFAEEPPRSLALVGRAAVVATSHIGAFTDESIERATVGAVENLLSALAATDARASR